MGALYTPIAILYYTLAAAAILIGAWLLRVMYEIDMATPEQLARWRGWYMRALFAQWIVSIGLAFVGNGERRFELYYFALLAVPILFAIWNSSVARQQDGKIGDNILLVFLSVLSLMVVVLLGLYG